MATPAAPKPGLRARVDGRRVLFEVEEGGKVFACAISLGALQDISSRRHFRAPEVLQCFIAAQTRIEAAARHKLRNRAAATGTLLNLWADDFEEQDATAAE
jgi:hypothetical protein